MIPDETYRGYTTGDTWNGGRVHFLNGMKPCDRQDIRWF